MPTSIPLGARLFPKYVDICDKGPRRLLRTPARKVMRSTGAIASTACDDPQEEPMIPLPPIP